MQSGNLLEDTPRDSYDVMDKFLTMDELRNTGLVNKNISSTMPERLKQHPGYCWSKTQRGLLCNNTSNVTLNIPECVEFCKLHLREVIINITLLLSGGLFVENQDGTNSDISNYTVKVKFSNSKFEMKIANGNTIFVRSKNPLRQYEPYGEETKEDFKDNMERFIPQSVETATFELYLPDRLINMEQLASITTRSNYAPSVNILDTFSSRVYHKNRYFVFLIEFS